MTFSLRRKRRTIRRAWRAKRAMTIISLVIAGWSMGVVSVQAQTQVYLPPPTETVVTPKFVPMGQRANTGVVNVSSTLPAIPAPPPPIPIPIPVPLPQAPQPQILQPKPDMQIMPPGRQGPAEDFSDLRLELPGQQRLFMRESEAQFYERIRQDAKRYPGSVPAIFPTDEPVISRESYVHPNYPRLDPRTKKPVTRESTLVEPCYVVHRRLLFEQPNFERGLYDLGVAQPFVSLGVFYYDVAMAPYHIWSDLRDRNESSLGKCLPGDSAPFTVPCERFSVTGLVGEAGAIVGLGFLFP